MSDTFTLTWHGALDVHDRQWWDLADLERSMIADWVATQQHGDRHRTWRVEFHVNDGPMLRIYNYRRGEGGRLIVGVFGDVASDAYDVMMRGQLPEWWKP